MNTETQAKEPHRRFQISITVGGDDLESAIDMIEEFTGSIRQGSTSCVTGGSSAGGYFRVNYDPEMTHERYFEALKKNPKSRYE